MDDEFENDNAVGDPPESLLEQVVNRMGAETLLEGNGDDVHALLLQRENDLLLAAQLGKSLMEKNHFLQEQQKQLTEEYTFRLEELHLEKMKLQKNQKKLESEYENVVIELQNEIAQLKKEINRKQSRNEKEDQAKYLMAQELKEHNEYLSDKLQKVSLNEAELRSQVRDFQQQINMHRVLVHGHVQQLETLHSEILKLNSQRNELDQKVTELLKEKGALLECLQESQDMIVQLQREREDQDARYAQLEKELAEIRLQNTQLLAQLSDSDNSGSSGSTLVAEISSPTGCEVSLFDEMRALRFSHSVSMDSLEPFMSPPPYIDNPFFASSEPPAKRPHSLHIVPEVTIMNDDECGDEFLSCISQDSLLQQQQFHVLAQLRSPLPNDKRYCQLKREIAEVYAGLRQMLIDSGVNVPPPGDCLQPGTLFNLMQEVQAVMTNLLRRQRSEFLVNFSGFNATSKSNGNDSVFDNSESCKLN